MWNFSGLRRAAQDELRANPELEMSIMNPKDS